MNTLHCKHILLNFVHILYFLMHIKISGSCKGSSLVNTRDGVKLVLQHVAYNCRSTSIFHHQAQKTLSFVRKYYMITM